MLKICWYDKTVTETTVPTCLGYKNLAWKSGTVKVWKDFVDYPPTRYDTEQFTFINLYFLKD